MPREFSFSQTLTLLEAHKIIIWACKELRISNHFKLTSSFSQCQTIPRGDHRLTFVSSTQTSLHSTRTRSTMALSILMLLRPDYLSFKRESGRKNSERELKVNVCLKFQVVPKLEWASTVQSSKLKSQRLKKCTLRTISLYKRPLGRFAKRQEGLFTRIRWELTTHLVEIK